MAEPLTAALDLPDARATEALGRRLARHLPEDTGGFMILLEGDLGAGKSTLARALLRALGHAGPVPSPTYTLVEPYAIGGRTVYHVDLYRLTGGAELPYLGWSDMEDGLVLVEWPERVPSLASRADLIVRLRYRGAGRAAELVAPSPSGFQAVRSVMP